MAEFSIDRFVDTYARRAAGMTASEVRALFAVAARPEVVSLAGGMPFVQAIPSSEVIAVAGEVLAELGDVALQYGGGQGIPGLRERLAMLMAEEGVIADPEDVVVTTGAQQALDLIGKIFIDPGDLIAVEAPAYVGALTAFGTYEPRYLPIELDDDGMLVEQLEQALVRGERPKFVYTVPDFGNPSGVTMSYARREQLVALCREASIPIIEDNPYGLLRFEGEAVPCLRTLDPDNVIYLGTVSKTFSPGVRVGWALAEPSVVQRLILAKEAADLCGSSLNMLLTERWFSDENALADNVGQPRRYVSVPPRRHVGGTRGALPGGVDLDAPARRVLRLGDPAGMARREGAAGGGGRATRRLRAGHRVLSGWPGHEQAAARVLLPDRRPHPRGRRSPGRAPP